MQITRLGVLSGSWTLMLACAGASDPLSNSQTGDGLTSGDGETVGEGETLGEGGDGDGDGDTGDGDTGDGDGDTGDGDTGDGDGDTGDGDGDGDTGEPVCGDGIAEGQWEECDDGNDVNDDGCTNDCKLPVCGDGIVQAGEGETCDDGNDVGGDTCTAVCIEAGTVLWEDFLDLGEGADRGFEVEIGSEDDIDVLVHHDGSTLIYEFDAEGNELWSVGALDTGEPSLAINTSDALAIGGFANSTGQVQQFHGDGTLDWFENVPHTPSEILAVAIDDTDHVIAAGFEDEGDPSAVLMRVAVSGQLAWVHSDVSDGAFGPVGTGSSADIIYAWHGTALERYDLDGNLLWLSNVQVQADYRAIAVDADDQPYVLANDLDVAKGHTLRKFSGDGVLLWATDYDNEGVGEGAHGLATLPNGGAIVAGFTNASGLFARDGLLAWYTVEGDLLFEFVLDGAEDNDREILRDVAVDEAGGYAVAVGSRSVAWGEPRLWIRKFAI